MSDSDDLSKDPTHIKPPLKRRTLPPVSDVVKALTGVSTAQPEILFKVARQVCQEELNRVKQGKEPATLDVLVRRAQRLLGEPVPDELARPSSTSVFGDEPFSHDPLGPTAPYPPTEPEASRPTPRSVHVGPAPPGDDDIFSETSGRLDIKPLWAKPGVPVTEDVFDLPPAASLAPVQSEEPFDDAFPLGPSPASAAPPPSADSLEPFELEPPESAPEAGTVRLNVVDAFTAPPPAAPMPEFEVFDAPAPPSASPFEPAPFDASPSRPIAAFPTPEVFDPFAPPPADEPLPAEPHAKVEAGPPGTPAEELPRTLVLSPIEAAEARSVKDLVKEPGEETLARLAREAGDMDLHEAISASQPEAQARELDLPAPASPAAPVVPEREPEPAAARTDHDWRKIEPEPESSRPVGLIVAVLVVVLGVAGYFLLIRGKGEKAPLPQPTAIPAPESTTPAATTAPEPPQPTPSVSGPPATAAPVTVPTAAPTTAPTAMPTPAPAKATATPVPAPPTKAPRATAPPEPSRVESKPTAAPAVATAQSAPTADAKPKATSAPASAARPGTIVSTTWSGKDPVWVVHLGSSKSKESSLAEAKRLAAQLGKPAHAVEVDLGEKGIWFRLVAGDFPSQDEAAKFRAELAAKNHPNLGMVYHLTGK